MKQSRQQVDSADLSKKKTRRRKEASAKKVCGDNVQVRVILAAIKEYMVTMDNACTL
jgi:hypothetical protein